MAGEVSRRSVRDYYEGGSGDETTIAENESAWRAIRFRPHVLRAVGEVSTDVELLGSRVSNPFAVAPTALHGLADPMGEAATVAGAGAAGSLFVLSTRSSTPIEQVAAASTGPWWMQVYAMRNRDLTFELARRAASAGASALVLTGDTPVVGRKRRATPGLDVAAIHLANLRSQTHRVLSAEDVEQDPAIDPTFIERLRSETGLPVVVKGVLRGDDAIACIDAGAAGLIVSNHGGRQLDRVIPTAAALPTVAAAVGGAVPVLVDGGIRSGLDALAAFALGARAVLVGRPALSALGSGGADSVARLLSGLRSELAHAMALAGLGDVSAIDHDLLSPEPH